jgi:hypothetical protein
MIRRERNDKADAEILAAILDSDDVTQEVCDYIADVVHELAGDINLATPEVLRVAWPLIMAQYDHTNAAIMQPLFMALRAIPDDETREAIERIMFQQGTAETHSWPDVVMESEGAC